MREAFPFPRHCEEQFIATRQSLLYFPHNHTFGSILYTNPQGTNQTKTTLSVSLREAIATRQSLKALLSLKPQLGKNAREPEAPFPQGIGILSKDCHALWARNDVYKLKIATSVVSLLPRNDGIYTKDCHALRARNDGIN